MTSKGAALLLLSLVACFQYLSPSCHAHKSNINGGFVPSISSRRSNSNPSSTLAFAPLDNPIASTSTPISANNNDCPSRVSRERCYKVQISAKNSKKTVSNFHVEEEEKEEAEQKHNIIDTSDNLNGAVTVSGDDEILGTNGEISREIFEGLNHMEGEDGDENENEHDMDMMRIAIGMAASSGGERGRHGPFPRPVCGAVLVAKDGRVSNSQPYCFNLTRLERMSIVSCIVNLILAGPPKSTLLINNFPSRRNLTRNNNNIVITADDDRNKIKM